MSDTAHTPNEGFPPHTPADWQALATKALRGADFEQTLKRSTGDGIERGPVFFDTPETAAALPFANHDPDLPWAMRQTIVEADPAKANTAILDDLMGGVSEIELRLDPEGRTGLKANELDLLDKALQGVDLSLAPIHLDCVPGQGHHAHLALTLFARRRLDGEILQGGLGIAPIERAARQGADLDPECFNKARSLVELAQAAFPKLRVFRANSALIFEAGGSEVQELAAMAAAATAYIRLALEVGLDADQACQSIELRLAADTDIHLTIAKLRAARRIFARIAESFGASEDARTARIQAITAGRMLSAKDPWTNLIRNACAGFAAAAGGADAITIRPLTDAIGRPSGFARRVARNLHILLAEESHIGIVTDPAAGSYLHEGLSDGLAQKAWALFQEIEGKSGLAAVFASGWLQDEIATARDARLKRITDGAEIILGVTRHPDPDPKPVEVDSAWPEISEPATALVPVRLPAGFEGEVK